MKYPIFIYSISENLVYTINEKKEIQSLFDKLGAYFIKFIQSPTNEIIEQTLINLKKYDGYSLNELNEIENHLMNIIKENVKIYNSCDYQIKTRVDNFKDFNNWKIRTKDKMKYISHELCKLKQEKYFVKTIIRFNKANINF